MKIFSVIVCLVIIAFVCGAEDISAYFDRLGYKLYKSKNYTESMDYFAKALDQNPENIDAWIHTGDAQRVLKDYNSSRQSYDMAIQLDQKNKDAWDKMADALSSLKDYANASAAAAKATELDNKKKEKWLREANLLQKQSKFEESIEKYDHALALNRSYKAAMYGKAISLLASNNTRELRITQFNSNI